MVTIGIPFYNSQDFLEEAILSVIEQSFTNWQLILIDDGSTDNSLSIAKNYEKQDFRIKVVSDGVNKGLAYRLNEIAQLTTTQFLVRMDADDIMHPIKIEKQLELLRGNDFIDVLGTNTYTLDQEGMVSGIRYAIQSEKDTLVKVASFVHPTIMARTKWFLDNPYDNNAIRMEDAELWYRTKGKYNFYMQTTPLFFYREFGSGYYMKYWKSLEGRNYILKKYNNAFFWLKYYFKVFFKMLVYRVFGLLGWEQYLLNKRNDIVFKTKKQNFKSYLDAQT
ncbi:glycosyltransferase family 2 protein [Mesonia sp. HuA40]|nr:glycosyltransferase family 2 protein [Mesonia sp. HuA40]